jgi:hypothetical protein
MNYLDLNKIFLPFREQVIVTPESIHKTFTFVPVEFKHRPRNHFFS